MMWVGGYLIFAALLMPFFKGVSRGYDLPAQPGRKMPPDPYLDDN